MKGVFSVNVITGILNTMIALATPFLYAALGETIAQSSGVVNLGVDGIMLLSAFAAFYVALTTGSLWLGLLTAALVGLLLGLLMSFVSVTLKAEQGVSGIGLYMFGLGMSSLLFKVLIGTVKTVIGFPPVPIPLLADIPFIGSILFRNSIPVYGAFLLVPVVWWMLEKTTLGLRIKSVGQNPAAADSLGISVNRIRYFSVCLGATLAGIAGASLSISLLNLFQDNLTAGQGFIAVALVYFGGWNPVGVMGGALLFSVVNSFQLWMQVLGVKIPSSVAVMLPYLLTIAALTITVNRMRQPAALNKPFERGEN
jgi:simple sugar transport system permease protein